MLNNNSLMADDGMDLDLDPLYRTCVQCMVTVKIASALLDLTIGMNGR